MIGRGAFPPIPSRDLRSSHSGLSLWRVRCEWIPQRSRRHWGPAETSPREIPLRAPSKPPSRDPEGKHRPSICASEIHVPVSVSLPAPAAHCEVASSLSLSQIGIRFCYSRRLSSRGPSSPVHAAGLAAPCCITRYQRTLGRKLGRGACEGEHLRRRWPNLRVACKLARCALHVFLED